MPVDFLYIDTTGDGRVDAMVADTDADGRADALVLDTTSDGQPDTAIACMCFDTSGNGAADILLVDTTDDGRADTLIRIFSALPPLAFDSTGGNPFRVNVPAPAAPANPAVASSSIEGGRPRADTAARSDPPVPMAASSAAAPALDFEPGDTVSVATGAAARPDAANPTLGAAASFDGTPSCDEPLLPLVDDDVFGSIYLNPVVGSSQTPNPLSERVSAAGATAGDSLQLPLTLPMTLPMNNGLPELDDVHADLVALDPLRGQGKGKVKGEGNLLKHGWTPEEDETIVRMVQLMGQKWSYIANALPGRTDDAVRNRYLRLQKKKSSNGEEKPTVTSADLAECQATKKGDMWTADEDAKIMEGVAQHGFKWQLIAHDLPGRSANAVRNRFLRCSPAHGGASASGMEDNDAPGPARCEGSPPPDAAATLGLQDFSEELVSGNGMNIFWDAAALYGEALESLHEDASGTGPFPSEG